MNRISALLIFFTLVMLTTNCNRNRIFSEQKDIANHRWEKNNAIVFTPEISDTSKSYYIIFTLSHVYGFQPAEFPINIELRSPSGQVMTRTFLIPFFDSNKRPLSDCSGDYCDLATRIEDNFKFNGTGKFEFKITFDMKVKSIPNIMQVGLIIETKH